MIPLLKLNKNYDTVNELYFRGQIHRTFFSQDDHGLVEIQGIKGKEGNVRQNRR